MGLAQNRWAAVFYFMLDTCYANQLDAILLTG